MNALIDNYYNSCKERDLNILLHEAHKLLHYYYIRQGIKEHCDRDDYVQETLIRLSNLIKEKRFDTTSGNITTYLYAMCTNNIKDHSRNRRSNKWKEVVLVDDFKLECIDDESNLFDSVDVQSLLAKALSELNDNERIAMTLRLNGGKLS